MTTTDLETSTALHLDALSKIHSLALPQTASFETKRLVRYLETHLQAGSSSTTASALAGGGANSSSAQITSNSSNARGRITHARGGLWGEPSIAVSTSDAGTLKTAPKRRGPLGLRLMKLLPSWHAIHNERCKRCGILSVPGINATYQVETRKSKGKAADEGKRQEKSGKQQGGHGKLIRQCLHCGAKKPRDMPRAGKKRKLKQLIGKDGRGLADQPIVLDDSSPVRMDTSFISVQSSRSPSSSSPSLLSSSSRIVAHENRTPSRQAFEPRTPARPEGQGKPGNLLRRVFTPHTPAREPVASTPADREVSPPRATASESSMDKTPAPKHMTLDQIAALKKKENKRKRKEMEKGDDDASSPAAKEMRMEAATEIDDNFVSEVIEDVIRPYAERARSERTEASREASLKADDSTVALSSSVPEVSAPTTTPIPHAQRMSIGSIPDPVTPARPISLDERAALAKAEKKRQKKEAKTAAVASPSDSNHGTAKAGGPGRLSSASSRSASVSPFDPGSKDKSALKAMLQADKERKKAQSSGGSAKPQSGLRNVFG